MVLTRFFKPTCVVKNISKKAVRVIGITTLNPGEVRDLYEEIDPRIDLFEDPILKGLEKPHGDLYVEVVLKKTLEILALDLPEFHYSIVGPTNINSTNTFSPGQVPAAVDEEQFVWIDPGGVASVDPPLQLSGGNISIPPADSITDGYLTKEDYTLFFNGIKQDQRIWQYQDFLAPASSSLTLTAFENGTGLAFDSSYILDDSAVIVLTSNIAQPPTTTTSFPANLLPGNRVSVSSHIGTTVTLNNTPEASQGVRVYYQISLPQSVSLPNDYQEDPEFANDASLDFLDDLYVNQNAVETIYGTKTFDSQSVHSSSIRIPVGAAPGRVLTSSDALGNAIWSAPQSGGGDGYWTSDNDIDIYNNNVGGVGVGTTVIDGYAQFQIDSTTRGLLIPRMTEPQRNAINNSTNGLIIYNTDENRINLYDGYINSWIDTSQPVTNATPPSAPYPGQLWVKTPDYELFVYDNNRGKWLSPRMTTASASRLALNASNIYLRTSDRGPSNIFPFVLPFDATLIGITASNQIPQTWTVEVRIGNVLVPGASLTISTATTAVDYSFNIDFSQGDAIQIYCSSSTGIRRPRANLFFARRGS